MSLIIRPPWTRQPQQAVEIDWANPVMSWVGDVFMPIGGKLVKFSRPESVLGAKTDNDSGVIISKIGIGVTVAQASMGSSFSRVGAYATTQVSQLAVLTNPASFGGNAFGHVCGVWGYYDDGFAINCTGEKWQARINAASNTTLTGGAANIMQSGVVSMAWDGATLSLIDMGGGLYSTSVSGTLAVTSSPYSIGGVNLALNYGYNGGVHLVLSGRRFATIGQRRELHNNPWQIFKPPPRRIWVAPSGGAVNGTGSGSLSQSNLSPVLGVGSSTSDATGIGSLDDISLQAILANASSSVTGSGLLSSISLSSVSGSAQASAQAVSALASIILTAISGSASTTGAGNAAGALSLLSLGSVNALATGSGNANTALRNISLTAPEASAFTGAVGSGELASLSLSGLTGNAAGNALVTAALRAISLGTVNASATSGAPQTLNQADIDAIVTALLTDPRLLTVAKFLALK